MIEENSNLECFSDKITILGFREAGWLQYMAEKEKTHTIYCTSNPIYDFDRSIYGKSHGLAALEEKLKANTNPSGLDTIKLNEIINLLKGINTSYSREAIIRYFLEELCIGDEEEILSELMLDSEYSTQTILDHIEAQSDPTQEALRLILKITEYADPVLNGTRLEGYTFIHLLSKKKDLDKLFHQQDNDIPIKFKHMIQNINFETRTIETQYQLTASKKMVVDTLQENLYRSAHDLPIIPLHIVISCEMFTPDWNLALRKKGDLLTNSEIRMIYKLMYEVKHPRINNLMLNMVKFIKSENNQFLEITAPWTLNQEGWSERTRSKDKVAYFFRSTELVPNWLKELINFARLQAEDRLSRMQSK